MTKSSVPDGDPLHQLMGSYEPLPGAFDEMLTSDGELRPHWQGLMQQLGTLGLPELRQRQQQARKQIERDGVTFNPYDPEQNVSRPWALDPVPLVLTEAEWSSLSERCAQRARLLEAILADLFGPQKLIRDKVVPPDLLFGHPGYHPAYHGLHRPGQKYLDHLAVDLARGREGKWWVTGDRTRAPFGLGYVVENRIVTGRMLSDVFRRSGVHRLAAFFKSLKEELRLLAPRFQDNPRIVLWTKGPQSRAYFEDSYLARYLGYTLVEGEDLAVRDNCVMLKTLGGLLPVEVLFRRLDDDDCDPVELNGASVVGVSGLLDVLRAGKVSIANALGSRLVEAPMLLAFLPGVCEHLFDEELQMPSAATWWCGERKALQYVLEHLDALLIRPAYRMGDQPPVHPALMSKTERADLIRRLKADPHLYVGQEPIARSTTPVVTTEGIEPWYLALRSFMVASGDGYQTLPGGLARVSPKREVLDFTMTTGERSQDVWILAETQVDDVSLLAPVGEVLAPRRGGSELPSRVADNLFWLGRYMERAEQMARMLGTVVESLSSDGTLDVVGSPLIRTLIEQGQIEPDYAVAELATGLPHLLEALPAAVFDTSRPRTFRSSIENAARVASKVRDRIAVDMWRLIDRIDQMTRPLRGGQPRLIDIVDVLETALAELVGFSGLASESMTRTLGWRFLDLGCRIERAWQTSQLLRGFFVHEEGGDAADIETILRVSNSLMTYRNRYLANMQVPVTLDLLLTDETNPRSVIYQLNRINDHLDKMPQSEHRATLTGEQRMALSLLNAVRLADLTDLAAVKEDGRREHLDRLLMRLNDQLPKLSDQLSSRFLIHAGLQRHFALSSEGRERRPDGPDLPPFASGDGT